MNDKQCPKCNSVMKFREGVSKKNGKPYRGFFCTNKPNCNEVEFLPLKKTNGGNGDGIQLGTEFKVLALLEDIRKLLLDIAENTQPIQDYQSPPEDAI